MNKDSIIKILLVVIIVLLLINILLLSAWGVISLVVGNRDQTPSRPETPPSETQTDAGDLPVVGTPDPSVVLEESADMGQEYIDSIIFLGDSTTYHMINRAVLTGGKQTKQVWSGASGWLNLDGTIHTTTIRYPDTGEEMTVAEAVALKKPEYLVITLGIDYGVAYCNQAKFTTYYGKLLAAIKQASPDTKIMLQSIFPVSASYEQGFIDAGKEETGITNAKIDTANTWVMQLAKEYGCKYLDTASVLKNENGAMSAIYDAGDGIHMTADAYKAILQYIRTHGYTD